MKSVLKTLADEGMVISLSEGRRLISQGAIKLDGEPVMNSMQEIPDGEHVVCVGNKICKKITSGDET